jgi:hypothetical protein
VLSALRLFARAGIPGTWLERLSRLGWIDRRLWRAILVEAELGRET